MHRFADSSRGRSGVSLRLVPLLLVLGGMTFSPAAAAGGSRVSPSRWAASMCDAIDEWGSDIDDLELDAYPIEEDNPRLERSHLRALLEGEVGATDHLLTKLERAGEPSVKSGKTIARDLHQAFREVRSAMRRLRREATRIVGSDKRTFLNNRAALARNVADAGIGLFKDLGQIASRFPPQLTQAIEEDCDPIEEWALGFGDVRFDLIEEDCFSAAPGGPEQLGGNEFVVVVPGATPHTSEIFADVALSDPLDAATPAWKQSTRAQPTSAASGSTTMSDGTTRPPPSRSLIYIRPRKTGGSATDLSGAQWSHPPRSPDRPWGSGL
jgi:hypothetical protein